MFGALVLQFICLHIKGKIYLCSFDNMKLSFCFLYVIDTQKAHCIIHG